MKFNENMSIKTVFGNVEIKYIDNGYVATVLDGEFNGWNNKGVNRDSALKALLEEIAVRYAVDMVATVEI